MKYILHNITRTRAVRECITSLLLLIAMLWHRQVIFKSKEDKATELSRIKLKPWTQHPVPMISGNSAHSTPLPFGLVCHATYCVYIPIYKFKSQSIWTTRWASIKDKRLIFPAWVSNDKTILFSVSSRNCGEGELACGIWFLCWINPAPCFGYQRTKHCPITKNVDGGNRFTT